MLISERDFALVTLVKQGGTGYSSYTLCPTVSALAPRWGTFQTHIESLLRFSEYKESPGLSKRIDPRRFTQMDFRIDKNQETCYGPAGREKWRKAKNRRIGHHLFMQFQAILRRSRLM